LANGRSESSEPEWLSERRRKGASLARELELPTQKEKGWEFTDLADLDLDAFSPAEPSGDPLNGSRADGEGPVVLPLDEAADRHPDLVRERLGSLVSAKDPFVARNEANWRGGALVYVPAGQRLEEPVRIEALQKGSGSSLAWRTLVVLGEDAEAEVWESYRSADDELVGLFNGVVELIVGPGARLRYVCGQELSERSWVFASQRATVERDGSLEWVALGFGSARGKVRMETDLAGQGANAKVTGAYAGTASQHLDYDTTQEHAAPHTTSDLAFRGVLAGKATAVWRGMIKVDPGAQRTDAFQESRNLLLSQRAHADAIPGLEIEANDVRCTHAAAVAQLDPDQLFYLRSHGLEEATAKRLVIEGFLQALVDRLPGGTAGELVSAALERRLSELLASS
jgi:Fe-S cluster assembly protein SufD